jgi:hypothetical protein
MANKDSNTKPMPVTQSNPPTPGQAQAKYGDNQPSKNPNPNGVRP